MLSQQEQKRECFQVVVRKIKLQCLSLCLKHINALPLKCQTVPGWPQTGTGFVLQTETLSEQKLLTKLSCSRRTRDRKPRLTVRNILVFWWGMIYSEVVVGVEESDADIFFRPVLQNGAKKEKKCFFSLMYWREKQMKRLWDGCLVIEPFIFYLLCSWCCSDYNNSLAWWRQSVVGQFYLQAQRILNAVSD